MDRIKRLSFEILEQHRSSFGESFSDNKKTLDKFSIIRSKGLKNEIAGYITKFIKREIRDQKTKEELIAKQAKTEAPTKEINSNPSETTSPDLEKESETTDIPAVSSDTPESDESTPENQA